MPMVEKEVIITTKNGRMPTFAACPDGPGSFPGIIFYMDAPGMRAELRNMARRIANLRHARRRRDLEQNLRDVGPPPEVTPAQSRVPNSAANSLPACENSAAVEPGEMRPKVLILRKF